MKSQSNLGAATQAVKSSPLYESRNLVGAAAVTEQISPYAEQVSMLHGALGELTDSVLRLTQRLAPVLRPADSITQQEVPMQSTELLNTIQNQRFTALYCLQLLEDIQLRLVL